MDTTSEVFDALGEPRRRRVLYALSDQSGPTDVQTLAEVLAEREEGRADPGRIQRVHLTLVHNHLPRLAEAGLVEYDPDGETVERARLDDPVEGIVESARALDGGE
jgi:DNA-binding transcriptional ArsR family regulator